MSRLLGMGVHVDAPPNELFDLMADPENETSWNPDALEVRRVDHGPLGPGSEWEGRYRGMGSMRVRLDEYERPRRLVFSTIGPRMDMRWAFTFSPEGAGSYLAAEAELTPKGAMRLMSPVLTPMLRRKFSQRPAQLSVGVDASRPQQG